jgi:class 3 adenylate cyclase
MAADVAGAALPAGTVTLLFSDIERSTRLLERHGARYAELLAEHHRIVRAAVAEHGGHEIRTAGDSFFVAFARAGDAVRAAVAIQRGLAAQAWPDQATVLVRIGLHTGEPRVTGDDYVGIDVHRAARICAAAHGGQIVVSETTARLVAAAPIGLFVLQDLGEHRLKDLSQPLRLHQVGGEGLAADLPPLRTLAPRGRRLRLVLGSRTTGIAAARRPPPAHLSDRTAWSVGGSCAGGVISATGAAERGRSSF